jgi:hypothetical protein
MKKTTSRLESTLERRVQDFKHWQSMIESSGKKTLDPVVDEVCSLTELVPEWKRKMSTAAQDIYQLASRLGIQDKYSEYKKFFNYKPKHSVDRVQHDMTPLHVIKSRERNFQDILNYND